MRKVWGPVTFVILALVVIALFPDWAANHPTSAWAVGIAVFGTLVIVVLIGGTALGAYWTHAAIERGATLATNAASSNDRWDANKTVALANLVRELVRVNGWTGRGGSYGEMSNALPSFDLDEPEMVLPPLQEFAMLEGGQSDVNAE